MGFLFTTQREEHWRDLPILGVGLLSLTLGSSMLRHLFSLVYLVEEKITGKVPRGTFYIHSFSHRSSYPFSGEKEQWKLTQGSRED